MDAILGTHIRVPIFQATISGPARPRDGVVIQSDPVHHWTIVRLEPVRSALDSVSSGHHTAGAMRTSIDIRI